MKVVGGPSSKGQTAEKLQPIQADIARALKRKGKPVKQAKSGRAPHIDIHVRVALERQIGP